MALAEIIAEEAKSEFQRFLILKSKHFEVSVGGFQINLEIHVTKMFC